MSPEQERAANAADIERTRIELKGVVGPCELPDALIEFWKKSNGLHGDVVEFYSTDEIVERNETLETGEFCVGFLAIANDAGSRVALLELASEADAVFLNYMGSMSVESMEDTKLSLNQWIRAGCPFELEAEPAVSAIEKTILQLDCIPREGIKALMNINRTLGLNLSLQELRSIPENLPFRLCATTYIKALRWASAINREKKCVSIWSENKPDRRLPLENPFE